MLAAQAARAKNGLIPPLHECFGGVPELPRMGPELAMLAGIWAHSRSLRELTSEPVTEAIERQGLDGVDSYRARALDACILLDGELADLRRAEEEKAREKARRKAERGRRGRRR